MMTKKHEIIITKRDRDTGRYEWRAECICGGFEMEAFDEESVEWPAIIHMERHEHENDTE